MKLPLVRGAPFLVLLGAVACASAPTTFVLAQAQRRAGFDKYQVKFTPLADDPPFDSDLKQAFEIGVLSRLREVEGMKALTADVPDERTIVLHYRAAGLSGGSFAARAGTAAVNAFLPVRVVPEVGEGDLGIESKFLDANGELLGHILVQSEVRGIFRTDAGTMRAIGERTAEFVGSRFASSAPEGPLVAMDAAAHRDVVNLCAERARTALAVFEPLVGEWEMKIEIRVPGTPTVVVNAHETDRWEAGGRVFYQYTEAKNDPEMRFRYNLVLWDPVDRAFEITSLDSVFGAHTSHQVTVERRGNVLKGVASEPERVSEFTETLSDDGKRRRGSKEVWSADRKRLLLTILSEGTRVSGPASRPRG